MDLLRFSLVLSLNFLLYATTSSSLIVEQEINQDETLDIEPGHRMPREVKFSFPGQDRFPHPKPPTALCFREPCKLPEILGGSTQGRFPRSPIPEVIDHDESLNIEPGHRLPRDVKFSFPGQDRIPKPPIALCFREPCKLPERLGGSTQGRFPRSPIPEPDKPFDKGFNDYAKDSNTRMMVHSSKSFGPSSHGGWESTARVEHDIWKSKDGSGRVHMFGSHDRVDGGRFDGFKDNKFGIGYEKRFRRSASDSDSRTRGSIYSTKSFGPSSHGGWQSTAKIEHDVWKSKDGNSRVASFGQHDRIDGGRFDGYKDSKVGIGYEKRFRRSASDSDSRTRGSIYSTKSFGPSSHGGWQSTAKIEHDVWKSKDGNSRVAAFGQHDRIDGGRFDGFKDSKVGIGYESKF